MKKTMTRNGKLQTGRMASAICLLVGALALLSPAPVRAVDGTWGTANGNWSDPTKWAGNVIGDGSGALISGPGLGTGVTRIITVDTARTIGQISMNCNGTGRTYVFTGSTITLSGTTPAQINALNGTVAMNCVIDGTLGIRARARNAGGTPFVYLNAVNIYSGDTEMTAGATRIGIVDAIPHGSGKGNVILMDAGNGYGTLDILSNSITINGLSGTDGTVTASSGGFTPVLTVGDNDATATFGGVLQDGGSALNVTKIGNGTQTLSGANTYSGLTTVSGGTLAIDGSIPANVQVDAGGTLGGIGTVGGSVTVAAGGSVGAGSSAGVLTVSGGLDLSSGGTNVWELASLNDDTSGVAGTDFDQVYINANNIDLSDATLDIRFIGSATAPDFSSFWLNSHQWTVIKNVGGGTINDFSHIKNASYASGTFSTDVVGTDLVLTFTPSGGTPPAARPRITSITGAGTSSVTVNYTNTVPTETYIVRYKTTITGAWTTNLPGKVAVGTSDFQVDSPVSGPERYYEVWYVAP